MPGIAAPPPPLPPTPLDPYQDAPPPQEEPSWPHVGGAQPWAVGVDTLAGLSMPGDSNAQNAHAFAGVLLRLRWKLVQLGGEYVVTDESDDQWKSAGGFGGVWLPFHRWVDVEAVAGVASRTYSSEDRRYGPRGYSITNTALALRIGASARSSQTWLGARAGGAIVAQMDLDRQELPWTYQSGPLDSPEIVQGSSPIGGFTFGLQISVGLDVSPPTVL